MSTWRRPATRTYDYNFRLGEHYYKPQLNYLETRRGRAKTPPPAKTFAERFAEDPIYGYYGPGSSRRSALGESDRPGMSKYGSMDDMNLGNKRRQLLDELDSRALTPSSPRLIMGDRLLDSIGIDEGKLSQPLSIANRSLALSAKTENDEQESRSLGARRRVGFIQSAQADLVSEDPFKSRLGGKLEAAKKHANEMLLDMEKESDSTVSRFRAKIKARKEEQQQQSRRDQISKNFAFTEDDDDTAALRSRINQIGERARARIAQLEDDDFPELQIGSSLAARRAVASNSFADEEDDSRMASRSMKISKRTVRASYNME